MNTLTIITDWTEFSSSENWSFINVDFMQFSLKLFSHTDEIVRERMSEIFVKITQKSSEKVLLMISKGVMGKICKLVDDQNEIIKSNAIRCLSNSFLHNCSIIKEVLIKGKADDVLFSALLEETDHTIIAKILEATLHLLEWNNNYLVNGRNPTADKMERYYVKEFIKRVELLSERIKALKDRIFEGFFT